MKTNIISLILLALALTACTSTQPVDIQGTAVALAVTEINLTQSALPTANSTAIPLPATQTSLPPSPTPFPKFSLDRYVMVFIKDGDLYFQDGNNPPTKLTHIGKKAYYPKILDDNQKVVFTRGGNIYSINTDGTQEQLIITKITNAWWGLFEPGIDKLFLGFVPNTHQLLFETYLCESQTFRSPCSTSIFLADADTGNIRKLTDSGLSLQQNLEPRNVAVSPDGKMVSVGTMEGMNIFTIDGKIIRHNIFPYKASTSAILFPSLYWLPDSSGMIVAIPDAIYHSGADGDLPAHTIWRYTINDNEMVQIPFKVPPMLDTFQVSPDGSWIVYGGLPNDNEVYLGDLANGGVQILGDAVQVYFSWAPGSQYFIATSAGSVLGAIDTLSLTPVCHLQQWVDSDHFTCWSSEIRMAEIEAGEVKIYELGFDKKSDVAVFIKPK